MDAAYFTGRKELLSFFNDLLDLNLTKIEETATGAVACQVTDLIFPGSIPMSRVNWAARSDYEFIQNYKLLQNAFTKNHVQRHVDVDKLIRAKYQDNLEFCQWLKAFFEQSGRHREGYDPSEVRARGKGGVKYNGEKGKSMRGSAASPLPTAAPKSKPMASKVKNQTADDRFSRPLRERASNAVVAPKSPPQDYPIEVAIDADVELKLKANELLAKVEDLELAVVETEKERNFYFEKLRNIEIMLQVYQEKGEASDPDHLVENVFKILYATAEDGLTVNEDGEVVSEDELIESITISA